MGKLDDLINNTFCLGEDAWQNKVTTLHDAIHRHIKPGDLIHISTTHSAPNAAVWEIIRQFYGKNPQFTVVTRGMRDYFKLLVHLKLLKKMITTFSGDVYPTYKPDSIIQKAYKNREIEIENWTILTLPLRLLAGALGIGFMPTNSFLGSDMTENVRSFKTITDPFDKNRQLGAVEALNPDISIVHGLAADKEGNTILTAPYGESVWGAKAARRGAIVTVEKLVSTEFIRKYSHLVKLPSYLVNSVSIVPFGAHPTGVWSQGIDEFDSYSDDYEFIKDFNETCRNTQALDNWIQEWIINCQSFEEYLNKVGVQKILSLKGNADKDAWIYHLNNLEKEISGSTTYSKTEMMVVAASREIRDRILKNNYKTLMTGAGTANLSSWLATYQLRKQKYSVELLVELGYYGSSPRPTEPFLLNFGNFYTCKMLTDTIDSLGIFACGATNRCIGVLGGAQVDKYGNINSTRISDNQYLVGSGGANDIANGTSEVVLVKSQSRKYFREKVDFVTANGNRIRTLVSDLGIFEKLGDDEQFTLTKYYGNAKQSKDALITTIKENCGWDLKIAENVQSVAPPTQEELLLLRSFDPKKYYLGE